MSLIHYFIGFLRLRRECGKMGRNAIANEMWMGHSFDGS